jgi:hypothetical protein
MARASGIPTLELFRSLGTNLIQKSNAFLIKVRKEEASGGKARFDNKSNKTLKPVAAYFPAPAETMRVDQLNKKIRKWQQLLPEGYYKEFNPEDVVHFYFNRKDGFIFGTPSLIPVIDDIRALRKIEENIELLVYQHLFPLFQFQVGTPDRPAGLTETGEREIDVLKREIQYMPSEGGIVTTDRHNISTIGAEGRALRAEKYLEHFKKRVIAGLGISSVDLGDADTSTRSTAENMSRNLVDSVKDFQQVVESFVDHLIINELLLESTFEEDPLSEENIVHLKFKEIDISTQIKKEAHYADQFNKDIVTHDEARIAMGRDPIELPSQEEQENDQDWGSRYPDWQKMRWKMFKEPELLIQSIDEPYSLVSKAAIANRSLGVTAQQAQEATADIEKVKKEKQKTKTSLPKADLTTRREIVKRITNTTDSVLVNHFNDLQSGITTYLDFKKVYDNDWISKLLNINISKVVDSLIAIQMSEFKNSYLSINYQIDNNYLSATKKARIQLTERTNYYIDKLILNINDSLKKNLTDKHENDYGTIAREVFNSFNYRISTIEDVELGKAKNFGIALALKNSGQSELYIDTLSDCVKCKNRGAKTLSLDNLLIDDLPPYHSACNCKLLTERKKI